MVKKYYSVWDDQTGRYMESGRNSSTKLEAIDEILEYMAEDWDNREYRKIMKWNTEQKENFLRASEFRIISHTKKVMGD